MQATSVQLCNVLGHVEKQFGTYCLKPGSNSFVIGKICYVAKDDGGFSAISYNALKRNLRCESGGEPTIPGRRQVGEAFED